MTIELPPDLAERVQQKVDSGEFATPLDVVRDAFDQQMDDDVTWMTRAELRQAIAIGIEQAERGELIPGEEVFRRLRERNRSGTAR